MVIFAYVLSGRWDDVMFPSLYDFRMSMDHEIDASNDCVCSWRIKHKHINIYEYKNINDWRRVNKFCSHTFLVINF